MNPTRRCGAPITEWLTRVDACAARDLACAADVRRRLADRRGAGPRGWPAPRVRRIRRAAAHTRGAARSLLQALTPRQSAHRRGARRARSVVGTFSTMPAHDCAGRDPREATAAFISGTRIGGVQAPPLAWTRACRRSSRASMLGARSARDAVRRTLAPSERLRNRPEPVEALGRRPFRASRVGYRHARLRRMRTRGRSALCRQVPGARPGVVTARIGDRRAGPLLRCPANGGACSRPRARRPQRITRDRRPCHRHTPGQSWVTMSNCNSSASAR